MLRTEQLKSFFLQPQLPHYHITRLQMLITAIISSSVPLLYYLPKNPFPAGFYWCAVCSALIHFALFFCFNNIFPLIPITLIFFSMLNVVLIGFVVHFSGGIVSPFNLFFICILISEAMYGVEYPLATPLSILTYIVVVVLEFSGIIKPLSFTAAQIYQNLFFTVFVAGATVMFIGFTGYAVKQIMRNMRELIVAKLIKEERLKKQLMALEAPSQVGLLVNKIVHDIRGPLGAVSGFIKLLSSSPGLDSERIEDFRVMQLELGRVSNLINRMIKYTKPGSQQKEPICPVDLMETVLSVISFYPGAKRVQFIREFPPSGQTHIFANKEELQQVYFNLLKNSIEALEKNASQPKITTKIQFTENKVSIDVIDNGPGMPSKFSEGKFSDIGSTKQEGAGLGLLIAKEIIESHGGIFAIQSQEGRGVTVRTRLPIGAVSEVDPQKGAHNKS